MVSNPRQSCDDIKKSGLYVIGHVKVGRLEDFPTDPILDETPKWQQLVSHMKIKAFIELTLAPSVRVGFQQLVRISGLVNTFCFGFYDNSMPTYSLLKTKIRKRRFFLGADFDTFFEAPRSENNRHLDITQYVRLIQDALKLQKNVFLCRNFQLLNKDTILGPSEKSYIDVWPVNFFRPDTTSYFDNTCLFMLQLACILTMQSGWKSHMEQSISENTAVKEKKLSTFLQQLRIQAKIVIVSFEHLLQRFNIDTDRAAAFQESEYESSMVKMHDYNAS